MWLYFLGIAKTSCSSFILPQEAFFFHCLLLLERFKLCCKRLNISMSTLIRQSLLGKPVQHTVLVAGGGEDALNILSALLGQCGKIGGNLNQLARHFNTGGRDTEQLRAQLLTELSALTSFRLDAEKTIGELYGNHQAYKLEEL